MGERKQMPFRYDEYLEKEIENLRKLDSWGQSTKNKTITNAVKIASAYLNKIRKSKEYALQKKKEGYFSARRFIEGDLNISLNY